jgi:phosphoribosylaminoimidazole (AIR) synthetase
MAVNNNEVEALLSYLEEKGEKPVIIGKIVKEQGDIKICHE